MNVVEMKEKLPLPAYRCKSKTEQCFEKCYAFYEPEEPSHTEGFVLTVHA